MAVVSVDAIWSGRTGGQNPAGDVEFTRVFKVLTDSRYDDPVVVLSSPYLPAIGDVYPTYAGAYLLDRKANQSDDDGLGWEVVCRYTSLNIELRDTPTDRATVWSDKIEWFDEPIGVDLDGLAIVNSAQEPFDIITRPVPVLVLTAKKNFVSYSRSADMWPFVGRWNETSFLGEDEGAVLLSDLSNEDTTENGTTFSARTYTFKVRRDRPFPWKSRVLDQGYMNWDPVNEKQYTAYTLDGQPLQRPVLLDGSGQTLAIWDGASPVYLDFRTRGTADFNTIGL